MALQEQLGKLRDTGPRAVTFLNEVWAEMKKVHWPTRRESYAATLVVLIVTVVIALYLGLVDTLIALIIQRFLG